MKCVDLFSGTRSIAKAFNQRGYETFTIELDKQHKNIVLSHDFSHSFSNYAKYSG